MTPEQIKQWQEDHGGSGGPPEVNANGDATYRAVDGNYVVVRSNGTLAMRGFSPPSDGASRTTPPSAAAPAQPSSGVGPASQAQVEARVAQMPGLVFRGQTLKTKTLPGLPGLPDKQIQVPMVSWVDPKTGHTIEAEVGAGGDTYTVVTDAVVPSNKRSDANDPTTPATQEAARIRDERWWNQNTPPNPANPREGGSGRAETHTERIDREAKEKKDAAAVSQQGAVPGYPGWTQRTTKDASGELTLYYPPGQPDKPQTSLPEKPDAPTKPTYQTIKGGDNQDYIRSITIGADGKPVIQTYDGQGHIVTAIPGEKQEPKLSQTRSDVDGQVYTTVTTIGADNKITVQTVDQQGKPVDRIPTKADAKYTQIITDKETGRLYGLTREGKLEPVEGDPNAKPQTGSAGPPLPQLVVGMSQAALRGYKEQLQAEVAAGRQTQTWANARWEEATQMATFAVQESTLQQREYETNLNANVNLAQSRLSYLSTGMGQALNFALSINDKLPKGSTLGGEAFAAILGLQSINMARSGINDIKTSPTDTRSIIERSQASNGLSAPPAPSSGASIRIANPGNAAAVEQQRQAVVGQLQEHVNSISNTTDAGGVPREYTPASSTNGASGQPPAAAPASPPSLFAGPAGAPAVDTGNVGISPDGSTAVAPDGSTAPVDTNRPLPTAPAPVVAPIPNDTGQTPPVVPIPADTGQPLDGPNDPRLRPMSMAPQPDLAVLANYRQPGPPAGTLLDAGAQTPPSAPSPLTLTDQVTGMPPQQPQIDPNGGGMPLAMLKQRLRSTPPWRLSDQDYAMAQQYGLEDDFWHTQTPRVGMAV